MSPARNLAEPNGDKPPNYRGVPGNWNWEKGNQRETSPEIMMELDPVERGQRETSPEIMMELDPVERKTKGDKPRNHDRNGSSRRETKTSLEIMMEQIPFL